MWLDGFHAAQPCDQRKRGLRDKAVLVGIHTRIVKVADKEACSSPLPNTCALRSTAGRLGSRGCLWRKLGGALMLINLYDNAWALQGRLMLVVL